MIVNISSGAASIPFPLYTLYAASKVSPASPVHLLCSEFTSYDHPRSNLCSDRCLWKDFLKVFKLNTKTKGLLYRYCDILNEPSYS